jgi:hypothetical protein
MAEKRMLIVAAEVVDQIDANRGDMGQGEFVSFLIKSRLEGNAASDEQQSDVVTVEALQEFEAGIKDMLRSFLDFVVSYGLELGHGNGKNDLEALSNRLQEMSNPSRSSSKK